MTNDVWDAIWEYYSEHPYVTMGELERRFGVSKIAIALHFATGKPVRTATGDDGPAGGAG